jgi:LPS-assembly protein
MDDGMAVGGRGMTWRWARPTLGFLVALHVSLGIARAEPAEEHTVDDLALFRADRISYDPGRDVVTADGNVEVSYKNQTLKADVLIYDQRTDTITAKGNVVLIDKGGNMLFASSAVLTDRLRNGVAEKIGILLSDSSRLAAAAGTRRDGRETTLTKAVYSPCELCQKNPERAPLWQIKARRIIQDEEKKEIIYNHARFELFGVPVAYTPYLEHPDPSVKRKTGLLVPSIGTSSDLGTVATVPVYWAIADSYDATFTPIYTTKEGLVLRGEFRQILRRGSYIIDGSITRVDERDDQNQKTGKKDWRGHLFGQGSFRITDTWQWGFNLQRVSDDTYLRRYDISEIDRLENRLYVEGIRGRNFLAANAYTFQDLRAEDDPGRSPLVAPEIEAQYVFTPPYIGGRVALNGSILSLSRSEGPDLRRLSASAEWQRVFVTANGQRLMGFAMARGDLYVTNDVNPTGIPGGPDNSTNVGRVLPEIGVEWRWPFARQKRRMTQVIEPIVQFVYNGNGGNPEKIPNEDSPSVEFDDTSLFERNRFPGLDRWDDGPHVDYALRSVVYWPKGALVEGLIGQSYRLIEHSPFAPGSGLDQKASDIVGHVIIVPMPGMRFSHRFRLDEESWSFARNETSINLRYWRFSGGANYTRATADAVAISANTRAAVAGSATFTLTKYWFLTASTQRDLTNHRTVFREIGLRYVDECIEFGLIYRRDFTRDRDVQPSDSVLVQFRLTNVG